MPNFFDAGNPHLYIAIPLSLINALLMCFACYKFWQIIQLSGYKIRGYFLWLRDTKARYVSRILALGLLSCFCCLVTNVLFDVYQANELFSYFGLAFYFYFCIVFITNLYAAPKKVPLKQTRRMTRLNVAFFIVVAVITFFIIAICSEYLSILKFGSVCLVPMFTPILMPLVHLLMVPLENTIVNNYIFKAKHTLKKYPNLIKIGITGSYGKTSTKYILNTLLSQKYKVCMSPHSFNTPTGLSKVINDYLKPENEVLIAEMGARNVGDIKKLATIVNPKYGIITGVGSQHLLSFNTMQNIYKTKYELVQALPGDGYVIFNADNEGSLNMFNQCSLKKSLVGLDSKQSEIQVSRIKVDKEGTHFTMKVEDKTVSCNTKLLGAHNVENIILCVRMALELGLSIDEIKQGIASLKPVPHRLEMTTTPEDVIVLDDSYNSSVQGSEVALDVLSKFGKNKIVVTPGLVELGRKEKEENINLGVKMAHVASHIIIVNKVNLDSIKEGIETTDFNLENVHQAETLEAAKEILKTLVKPGDAVLFENDLPDNYI